MITSFFLALVFQILNLALFFVDPVTSLPFSIQDNLNTVYQLVHAGVRLFPPLATAMGYLIAGISIELGYWTYTVVMRILSLIRG